MRGPLRDAAGREYWVRPPARVEADRTYWLVVLVHGFQGRGEDVLWLRRALAEFDDFVVVAPTFVEGFQLLERGTDRQLIDLFAALRRRFRLHDRMFLAGFSAGAQFSHRFTMRHPELVAGCAAHAGGTWGPALDPAARDIPFAVSCGLDDVARSSLGQPLTRVQGAHRYFLRLADEGFLVKARLFEGLGHATSPAVEALLAECYRLATRGLFGSTPPVVRGRGPDEVLAAQQDLMAKRTLPPRAGMDRRARQVHEVVHVLAGIGGRSADGARYWVDDSRENRDGWCDHAAARRRREAVLSRYLEARQPR